MHIKHSIDMNYDDYAFYIFVLFDFYIYLILLYINKSYLIINDSYKYYISKKQYEWNL